MFFSLLHFRFKITSSLLLGRLFLRMNDGSWQWRSKVIQYLYKTVSSEGEWNVYKEKNYIFFSPLSSSLKASFFPRAIDEDTWKVPLRRKKQMFDVNKGCFALEGWKILPSHRAGPIQLTYCVHLYKSFDWLQYWHPYCHTGTCFPPLNYIPQRWSFFTLIFCTLDVAVIYRRTCFLRKVFGKVFAVFCCLLHII